MTTTTAIRRCGRGIHPKGQSLQQTARAKGRTLPEYLGAAEVRALIIAALHARAKLLMLIQWRSGLRVSEALGLERADVLLNSDQPTIRVRQGKGRKSRIVPVHPELHNALTSVLEFVDVGNGRIIEADRSTAWRWVKEAKARAVTLGAIAPGRRITTHTLRHSYARHLLIHGIVINYLSRWMGHSKIETTLIYLELVPDPSGSLAGVP